MYLHAWSRSVVFLSSLKKRKSADDHTACSLNQEKLYGLLTSIQSDLLDVRVEIYALLYADLCSENVVLQSTIRELTSIVKERIKVSDESYPKNNKSNPTCKRNNKRKPAL